MKQAMNPSSSQLQSMLLDPAVNLLFSQMKREMDCSRTQLEQSQKDLAAWKFTPDRLVAFMWENKKFRLGIRIFHAVRMLVI
jgi:hypothetical protein